MVGLTQNIFEKIGTKSCNSRPYVQYMHMQSIGELNLIADIYVY